MNPNLIEYKSFALTEDLLHQRIDSILTQITDISRNQIQRLIRNSLVLIDNEVVLNSSLKVKASSIVTLILLPPEDTDIKPNEDIDLDIIYEDEDLLVINKQANLVTHPGVGHYNDTLVNALLHHKKDTLSGVGGEIRPGIVHRLDKDTSGLILVAKNDLAHHNLSEQIATKKCRRIYNALVWGRVKNEDTINAQIAKSRIDHFKMSIVRSGGKVAITHYKLKEIIKSGKLSLVECELETGRTHQIRLHMSHIGHSIFGDASYGNNKRKILNNFANLNMQKKLLDFSRQWLHSAYISFTHPSSNKFMEFTSPPPLDLIEIIDFIKNS